MKATVVNYADASPFSIEKKKKCCWYWSAPLCLSCVCISKLHTHSIQKQTYMYAKEEKGGGE